MSSVFVKEKSKGTKEPLFLDELAINPVVKVVHTSKFIDEYSLLGRMQDAESAFLATIDNRSDLLRKELAIDTDKLKKLLQDKDISDTLRGHKGEDGVPGIKGEDGTAGIHGLKGDPGEVKQTTHVLQEKITKEDLAKLIKELTPEEIEKLKGQKGPKGAKGEKGKKGIGLSGGQGPAGQEGQKGDKGDTGSTGVITPGVVVFAEVTGVGATETTIVTFTNTTGSTQKINAINGEGNVRAEWLIFLDNVLTTRARSSVSDPNIDVLMFDFEVANNSVVKVNVIPEKSGGDFAAWVNHHV